MNHEIDSGLSEIPVTIREYSPADSQDVFAISQRAPEAAQWPMDSYDQAVSSGQTVLIAEVGHQLCGFVVTRFVGMEEGMKAGAEAEVLNMAIAPAQRREGVGSMLLAAVLAEARTQRAERLYLEVRESNQAAISFYEKHGFAKAGKRHGYYRDPLENAVLMEKKLTA